MRTLILLLFLFSSSLFATDKTLLCAACHGTQGISANPEWPNLAQQNRVYFIKQLHDMQQGTQRNPGVMAAVIQSLTPQDIDDLANYYAKMSLPQNSTTTAIVERGKQLYRSGDRNQHITACSACHGPKGTGNAQAGFPLIAGQHAAYTTMQLNAFKKGERVNDLNHIMHDITSTMNEEDITAVAHYIESLY